MIHWFKIQYIQWVIFNGPFLFEENLEIKTRSWWRTNTVRWCLTYMVLIDSGWRLLSWLPAVPWAFWAEHFLDFSRVASATDYDSQIPVAADQGLPALPLLTYSILGIPPKSPCIASSSSGLLGDARLLLSLRRDLLFFHVFVPLQMAISKETVALLGLVVIFFIFRQFLTAWIMGNICWPKWLGDKLYNAYAHFETVAHTRA